MAKQTLTAKIYDKINELKPNESFNVGKFLVQIYGENTYWNRRSFDVMCSIAKKKIAKEQEEAKDENLKLFSCVKGLYTRIR